MRQAPAIQKSDQPSVTDRIFFVWTLRCEAKTSGKNSVFFSEFFATKYRWDIKPRSLK